MSRVVARLCAVAGALAVATSSACVAHPVGPARTFAKYEGKAVTTAEGARSAVETALLVAETASRGNAFGPYASVMASEAEESATAVQGTFASIQPPNAKADALRAELDGILGAAVEHLAALRVAIRRGELRDARDTARPLRFGSRELKAFEDAHTR